MTFLETYDIALSWDALFLFFLSVQRQSQLKYQALHQTSFPPLSIFYTLLVPHPGLIVVEFPNTLCPVRCEFLEGRDSVRSGQWRQGLRVRNGDDKPRGRRNRGCSKGNDARRRDGGRSQRSSKRAMAVGPPEESVTSGPSVWADSDVGLRSHASFCIIATTLSSILDYINSMQF